MAEQLKFRRFEDWIRHMFDHEVSEPQWYFEPEAPVWIGPPELTVEYIKALRKSGISSS